MATAIIGNGPNHWSLEQDDEGQRVYRVTFKVSSLYTDGPNTVVNTNGLPVPGDVWNFGNDLDIWAFCTRRASVRPIISKDEPTTAWYVDRYFSTNPQSLCQDDEIDDPLLKPQSVSGTFVKFSEEAVEDKDGNPIKTSSHEIIRGPQVEFDAGRPTVHIEQNVASLQLSLLSQLYNNVNDSTLWGLGPRRVKLSNISWAKHYYGTCYTYYTRVFDFDINYATFDRDIVDEGTKALHGRWPTDEEIARGINHWVLIDIDGATPDYNNPSHFSRYKDRNGENARCLLDGFGQPIDGTLPGTGTGTGSGALTTGNVATIRVKKYIEADLTQLGIPTDLEA